MSNVDYKTLIRLVDAYKLGQELFSEPLQKAAFQCLLDLGAVVTDTHISHDNIRIKL